MSADESNGKHYLVMELVSDENLAERISSTTI